MKIVVFNNEVKSDSTYSEFYTVHICGKCKHVLDHGKARYDSKCCYICGHRTGVLFDTQSVSVRDRYVKGKYIETIAV